MRVSALLAPKISSRSREGGPSALYSLAIATGMSLFSFGIAGLIFHLRLASEIAPLVPERPEIAQVGMSFHDIELGLWILGGGAVIQARKWFALLLSGFISLFLTGSFATSLWSFSGPSKIVAISEQVMMFQLEMLGLGSFLNLVLLAAWLSKTNGLWLNHGRADS